MVGGVATSRTRCPARVSGATSRLAGARITESDRLAVNHFAPPPLVVWTPRPLVGLRGALALVLMIAFRAWVLLGLTPSRVIRSPFALYTASSIVTEIERQGRLFRERNTVRGVHGLCGDLCGAETRAAIGLCWACRVSPNVTRARACTHARAGAHLRARNPAHPARHAQASTGAGLRCAGTCAGANPPRTAAIARARATSLPSSLEKREKRFKPWATALPGPTSGALLCSPAFCARVTPPSRGAGSKPPQSARNAMRAVGDAA